MMYDFFKKSPQPIIFQKLYAVYNIQVGSSSTLGQNRRPTLLYYIFKKIGLSPLFLKSHPILLLSKNSAHPTILYRRQAVA